MAAGTAQKAEDVIQQVLSSPYTRIPLYKGEPDNIIGVLHAKELLRAVHSASPQLASVGRARKRYAPSAGLRLHHVKTTAQAAKSRPGGS